MEQILKDISKFSVSTGEAIATEAQLKSEWLGFEPASDEQIKATEKRLGLKLPEDYINFVKITNGFSAPNQIEPSFIPVQEITFLKDSDPFLIEAYQLEELESAIFISGEDEEQHFFLIYPKSENEKWRYWKFANWYPGEHEFENLESYFADVLEFIRKDIGD
ncbi:SMI1/KNR4 family protein [Flavobacterium sp. RHBU_3]|uniref:SMI1/KNR4 family protein n=1 Tax=Flavobacterium sp. RHBU_3 TaxID=3391184 RepID=UPI0039851BAB